MVWMKKRLGGLVPRVSKAAIFSLLPLMIKLIQKPLKVRIMSGCASALQVMDLIGQINREEGTTFLISTHDEKIAARVPAWFRKGVNAGTFVIFPLCIKGNPVAMIYADCDHAGEIVIPEKELSLLRTLRNQALLAIKQSS